MKHLVLFSLFTVCTSYSMDPKDLSKNEMPIILKEAVRSAQERYDRERGLIIKNKPYPDKNFFKPDHNQKLYIECALMRLPNDKGNDNAHEVSDLHVAHALYRAHKQNKKLNQYELEQLAMNARRRRQLQITEQQKKESEEMVKQKLEEEGLLRDLLLEVNNESRPKKRYKIN